MDRLLNWYFALPPDDEWGIVSKCINRLSARVVKFYLDHKVFDFYKKTQQQCGDVLNTTHREVPVIVSLTSFPARLENVWIVIESMFRQTYKVDRIVLWLDKGIKFEELPNTLKQQTKRGLEVRFVDDIKSHTKYYYALQEFNDKILITVDDDCYYPIDCVENLIDIHKKFPNSISANRIHGIVFNRNNEIVPYHNWKHNFKPKKGTDHLHLLTGVSGVLYPPKIFNDTLFEREVFMDICKHADDIWLSIHAIINGVQVKTNTKFNKDFISISHSSKVRLLNYNSKSGGNDVQLKAVLAYLKIGDLRNYGTVNS